VGLVGPTGGGQVPDADLAWRRARDVRHPRRLRRAHPRPRPGVDLDLLHPAAQRVGVDVQLLADPPARLAAAAT
jgi:hypothetical protein